MNTEEELTPRLLLAAAFRPLATAEERGEAAMAVTCSAVSVPETLAAVNE